MTDIQNREHIVVLINAFYEKVREDTSIGPFFSEVKKVNWEKHLPVMYDFWESTLFYKQVYQGNPMKAHLDLHGDSPLKKEHFDKWQLLFKTTVDEHFQGENAELIKNRATSIATAIQVKIYQMGQR